MELEIATTHGVFKINKEYNIRRTLEPVNYLNGNPWCCTAMTVQPGKFSSSAQCFCSLISAGMLRETWRKYPFTAEDTVME